MKKIIISSIIAVELLAPHIGQAQGTTYLSNLGQPSAGSGTVGSDSWLGELFYTGGNAGGYVLNSVQLWMANASGNPSGFTVALYSEVTHTFGVPGSNLGSLGGSLDPIMSGIYTYTPSLNPILSPNTPYFIVLTAGTTIANGSYAWSFASSSSYNQSGNWVLGDVTGAMGVYTSSDGSSWSVNFSDYPQLAINATAVPEPATYALLGSGLACLGFLRRNRK